MAVDWRNPALLPGFVFGSDTTALGHSKLATALRQFRSGQHFKETKASIANKLAPAMMSAHLFLASIAAAGRETVQLEDI
jgi:hypothetical protein